MANWICHPEDQKDNYLVPVFRRRFELHQKVKKAVLRLSAHGLYEVQVNSAGVTENRFLPPSRRLSISSRSLKCNIDRE